jgi:hypothetical protein
MCTTTDGLLPVIVAGGHPTIPSYGCEPLPIFLQAFRLAISRHTTAERWIRPLGCAPTGERYGLLMIAHAGAPVCRESLITCRTHHGRAVAQSARPWCVLIALHEQSARPAAKYMQLAQGRVPHLSTSGSAASRSTVAAHVLTRNTPTKILYAIAQIKHIVGARARVCSLCVICRCLAPPTACSMAHSEALRLGSTCSTTPVREPPRPGRPGALCYRRRYSRPSLTTRRQPRGRPTAAGGS